MTRRKTLEALTTFAAVSLILAGCSSGSDSGDESTGGEASAGAEDSASSDVPQIDATAFTADFSLMEQLTDLAAQGDGLIGVLLPDTTTSTRYVQYDAPYLTQAFEAAGLSSDQFKIDNADGSAATMQTQAEADINAGASVLLVDPLDAGSGAAIEAQAEAAGVAVIDYDRLVTGGPEDRYYVSFDNVQVGELMGDGLTQCIDDWGVSDPNVLVMDGDPTDNNATLFNQGYMSVLQPLFDDGTYTLAGEPAGTWDPQEASTTFQQQQTAPEERADEEIPALAEIAAAPAQYFVQRFRAGGQHSVHPHRAVDTYRPEAPVPVHHLGGAPAHVMEGAAEIGQTGVAVDRDGVTSPWWGGQCFTALRYVQ